MALIVEEAKQEDNVKKGKLIRVELQPGRYVKMYEQDAMARGLVKGKPAEGDKMMRPAENKATKPLPELKEAQEPAEPAPAPAPAPADDFTTIAGIGPATARAILARNIRTFAELRSPGTRLDFLSSAAQAAIERWRDDG